MFQRQIKQQKNQSLEIKAAGFTIQPKRLIEESISGSVAAKERPAFIKLLDRLGRRNAMDVRTIVEQLANLGVKVHCLALGGVDLTSAAGKMTMQVIAGVAEFEKNLLIERTRSGINRAKAAGKRFGRPPSLNKEQKTKVLNGINSGRSVSELAREFKTSRQTIIRVRESGKK